VFLCFCGKIFYYYWVFQSFLIVIKETIILAGGFGRRLQKVVQDIPKPMADINGSPFLATLFNYLIKYGIEKIILSVGYKHDMIRTYFSNQYKSLKIVYAIEDEPLGTGGGIKRAAGISSSKTIFVLNGDSFFDVDLQKLEQFHIANKSDLTIALKPMHQFDRYGSVKINKQNRIIGFSSKGGFVSGTKEKPAFDNSSRPLARDRLVRDKTAGRQYKNFGYINGGIYVLNKKIFDTISLPSKFSFETDLMEKFYKSYQFYGLQFDEYFIDIGIPEDYEKAKNELNQSQD